MATARLNAMGLKSAEGRNWTPGKLQRFVNNPCYTGKHAYNVHTRVSDPTKPIEDLTAEIKRNRLQENPDSEWVYFDVPGLISGELWTRANEALRTRGRGRGKQGKEIKALLRGRILCPRCPRCSNPMIVSRAGRDKNVPKF